jgi:DNA-directed RNA polymerase subunit RPC12/RpoP
MDETVDQEAELSVWQDILDQVMAGRTSGHICPFCAKGEIDAEIDEAYLRVRCPDCGKWIEGRFS